MELGDWELAEKNWQELVRLNPRSLRGFGQLGNLYMCRPSIHLFDPARAELAFRQSVQLNPEETGALIRLGQAFLVAGRLDSAAAYLDAVIRTNPGSGQAGLLRSYIDWLRGGSESDPVSAGDAYQQILEPEGQVGEGDTRGGTGPMLARGAGCPLFEFETADPTADDPRAIEEDDARFRILSERLGAARSR
jgi:tetratricopeptide (TPR) repeat protein